MTNAPKWQEDVCIWTACYKHPHDPVVSEDTGTDGWTIHFVKGAWIFCMSYSLDMRNTSSKLYENPFIQNQSYGPDQKQNTQTAILICP